VIVILIVIVIVILIVIVIMNIMIILHQVQHNKNDFVKQFVTLCPVSVQQN